MQIQGVYAATIGPFGCNIQMYRWLNPRKVMQ
jgi:hypothetical protein